MRYMSEEIEHAPFLLFYYPSGCPGFATKNHDFMMIMRKGVNKAKFLFCLSYPMIQRSVFQISDRLYFFIIGTQMMGID